MTDVTAGSPAEAAGLRLGDVLLAIGDVPVTLEGDWGAAFRERYASAEGQPLALRVRRDGAETTLEAIVRTRPRTDITIASAPDADARAARLREGLLSR